MILFDKMLMTGKLVLWRCAKCLHYFTTEQAKEHKHD